MSEPRGQWHRPEECSPVDDGQEVLVQYGVVSVSNDPKRSVRYAVARYHRNKTFGDRYEKGWSGPVLFWRCLPPGPLEETSCLNTT